MSWTGLFIANNKICTESFNQKIKSVTTDITKHVGSRGGCRRTCFWSCTAAPTYTFSEPLIALEAEDPHAFPTPARKMVLPGLVP